MDSFGRVSGNAVIVRLEKGFHLVERPPRGFVFVIIVREEYVGEVNLAAWDVDQLKSVDEGLVEAIDVVVIGRANNWGEGSLGLRKEIFCVLGGGHCTDDKETGAVL